MSVVLSPFIANTTTLLLVEKCNNNNNNNIHHQTNKPKLISTTSTDSNKQSRVVNILSFRFSCWNLIFLLLVSIRVGSALAHPPSSFANTLTASADVFQPLRSTKNSATTTGQPATSQPVRRKSIITKQHAYWEHSTMSCYKPVVICGPSGVGKGTLIEKLQQHFPDNQFGFSVSHTTRAPRPGEVHGVHYHFTTVEDFQKDIADGKFIEHANVHGRFYGTSVAAVESVQQSGRICILDIDVQGVQSVKQSRLEPLYVFIAPPSAQALEQRLRGRGTETEEQVQTRLGNAAKELEYGQTAGNFDRVFVNNDLEECFQEMVQAFKEWYPHLKEKEN